MQAGIVGLGIMGRLLALALHKAGWQVTLFEKSPGVFNCSQAAAGLLTPYSELDRATVLISQLGQESMNSRWPRIMDALQEPIYFDQSGTVVVCHPRDRVEWEMFSQRVTAQRINHPPFYNRLSKFDLMQLEPDLTSFDEAYFFPEEGHIDCLSVMQALETYIQTNRLTCHLNTEVVRVSPQSLTTTTQNYRFDMVFDCRGLGAYSMFHNLRPIRGELIWLHAPEVQLKRPVRFLHPRYNLYIVPRPGSIYLIGASEIEAEDYSPISVRTTLELLTTVYYVHAGFAEARIMKTITHCRPTLSHHLPRIKFTDGLMAVNGLYRHGYLIAPALVEEILRRLNNDSAIRYPEIWERFT